MARTNLNYHFKLLTLDAQSVNLKSLQKLKKDSVCFSLIITLGMILVEQYFVMSRQFGL